MDSFMRLSNAWVRSENTTGDAEDLNAGFSGAGAGLNTAVAFANPWFSTPRLDKDALTGGTNDGREEFSSS
jgi:hypothetical protein